MKKLTPDDQRGIAIRLFVVAGPLLLLTAVYATQSAIWLAVAFAVCLAALGWILKDSPRSG